MSVLETPRIYFKGRISWDPIVTNNTPDFYDEDTAQSVLPTSGDKVKEFRALAIQAVTNGGVWNPHGTHRSTFYESAVCGFDLGSGVQTQNDKFIGAAALFTGMLVDLEPYGAFSSQLFFNRMQFGVDGGYRILAPRTSRFTARYLNFARNSFNKMIAGVASVEWQTSFAKRDGLRIDAFDSTALQALAQAMNAPDVLGLTVRFNTYRTIYFNDPRLRNDSPLTPQAEAALAAKLQLGGFQPNPARSLLVGTIGLWRAGEPAHEPGDRALCPGGSSRIAAAYARVDGTKLTLDLSNSVPEVDGNLTKLNLGTLSVVAVDPIAPATAVLGTIDYNRYDRAAYEASAGIVTVPLKAAPGPRDQLQLRDASGKLLLVETTLRAIPAEPNAYVDEGQSYTVAFQVYDRGAPAKGQIPVTVYKVAVDGTIENTTLIRTDASGLLSFNVVGAPGAITSYVPSPGNTSPAPSGGINPQVYTYTYVRSIPADAATGAMPPTWSNVYTNVLANWNAMAPCMDNWLRLDDESQVKSYGAIIKRLTDPANFEDFRFMPVTRDMTPGERTLLYRFLDAPAAGVAAPAFEATAAAAVAAPAPSFSELSRSMRSK